LIEKIAYFVVLAFIRLVPVDGESDGLFFVFKDKTSAETTYGSARFITIEKKPKDNASFTLDFNKAYNPPCAVSDYTTCPVAPKQNILPIRVEAGEKYVSR
jgi:uncharacterized protein